MTLYDSIGNNYNTTRCADERIRSRLVRHLNCAGHSHIADIGAGTGNYSFELARLDLFVYALEPSELMIGQGRRHERLQWIQAFAESIPFKDEAFDGAVCTLASHHFNSIEKGFKEIHRILKKDAPFVLFSQDPRKMEGSSWFREYLEVYYRKTFENLPEVGTVKNLIEIIFENESRIEYFNLPDDLRDGFFYSAWKYPESYLEEEFRQGISIFSVTTPEETKEIINKLSVDLSNGTWDRKYGFYRERAEFGGGYYFLSVRK